MGTYKKFKPRWEPGGAFKHQRIVSGGKKFKTGNGRKNHIEKEAEKKSGRIDWGRNEDVRF